MFDYSFLNMNDSEWSTFLSNRKEVARHLEEMFKLKKQLDDSKDYATAKWVKKEIIAPLLSEQRCYDFGVNATKEFLASEANMKMPIIPHAMKWGIQQITFRATGH